MPNIVKVQCEIVIDVGDKDPEAEATIESAETAAEDVLAEAEDRGQICCYLIK